MSFYTPVPGSSYEVRVAGRVDGVAAAPAAAAGTVPLGRLPHGATRRRRSPSQDGHVFVVAVRLTTPGRHDPIPLEARRQLIVAARGARPVVRQRRRRVLGRT